MDFPCRFLELATKKYKKLLSRANLERKSWQCVRSPCTRVCSSGECRQVPQRTHSRHPTHFSLMHRLFRLGKREAGWFCLNYVSVCPRRGWFGIWRARVWAEVIVNEEIRQVAWFSSPIRYKILRQLSIILRIIGRPLTCTELYLSLNEIWRQNGDKRSTNQSNDEIHAVRMSNISEAHAQVNLGWRKLNFSRPAKDGSCVHRQRIWL